MRSELNYDQFPKNFKTSLIQLKPAAAPTCTSHHGDISRISNPHTGTCTARTTQTTLQSPKLSFIKTLHKGCISTAKKIILKCHSLATTITEVKIL